MASTEHPEVQDRFSWLMSSKLLSARDYWAPGFGTSQRLFGLVAPNSESRSLDPACSPEPDRIVPPIVPLKEPL